MPEKNELIDAIIGSVPKTTYHVFVTLNGYEESYSINFDVHEQQNAVKALYNIADVVFVNVNQGFSKFDSDDVFIDVYVDVDEDNQRSTHLVISTSLGQLVNDLWSLGLSSLYHNLDYISMKMQSVLPERDEVI